MGYRYVPESVEFRRVERVSNDVEGALMNKGRQKSSRREGVFHVGQIPGAEDVRRGRETGSNRGGN